MKEFHVTPALVEGCYEMLRRSYPFRGWNLPDGDAVEFRVLPMATKHGTMDYSKSGLFRMEIDAGMKLMFTLVTTTAHEMVHMRQYIVKRRWVPSVGHGIDFKRLARQVCDHHGFNHKEF